MIVHGEQPWAGGETGRYGWWREVEPLWDGTARWEYVEPSVNYFTTFLSRIPSFSAMTTKVIWLEDTYLPKLRDILHG